jgi:hypothetical protein
MPRSKNPARIAAPPWRHHRDEAKNDPKRGFVGGYEMETLVGRRTLYGGIPESGCMGTAVLSRNGGLSADGRHGWSA